MGIVTPHSWGWTHTGTAAELRASERITAVEIFNHVAQHAATPVPQLLPPPLQDLSPTPNSSSRQTDRSGCQKLGTPQAPAALPTTLAPRPAGCSPGTPLTRNPRRYALPRLEARTDEAVWKTQPLERRGKEGWSPRAPGTHRARGPRRTARATAAPATRRDAERASSRPQPEQIRMGSGSRPGARLSRALPCPRSSPSPGAPAAPPLHSAQPGRRPKFG